MEPRVHYHQYGRFELRLPAPVKSVEDEKALWIRENPSSSINRLAQTADALNVPAIERVFATWALAKWEASAENWSRALKWSNRLAEMSEADYFLPFPGPSLIRLSACLHLGKDDLSLAALEDLERQFPKYPDQFLAQCFFYNHVQKDGEAVLESLNRLFRFCSVSTIAAIPVNGRIGLDDLTGPFQPSASSHLAKNPDAVPLISIIIPAYNAENHLATAISSLQQQTWSNLEILIVDDASTDQTVSLAKSFSERDSRIRLFCNRKNLGAYPSRNLGLQAAKGDFITVHDSDDWSHPDKIRLQVEPLLQKPSLPATVSHWARCDTYFRFSRWDMDTSWIHRNVSSLMFRRKVFETLGYWDQVKADADTEYYYRLLHAFGPRSVHEVAPGTPVAFGRLRDTSLTRDLVTHVRTSRRGLRRVYQEAARRWHLSAQNPSELFLEQDPISRPFPAPEALLQGRHFG